MPVYDYKCDDCGEEFLDVYQPAVTETMECRKCKGTCRHLWRACAVRGDEIDVEIKHGLCNPDGSPRRFRSRRELTKAEKACGWTNLVEHVPAPGSDKSKHTTRWI